MAADDERVMPLAVNYRRAATGNARGQALGQRPVEIAVFAPVPEPHRYADLREVEAPRLGVNARVVEDAVRMPDPRPRVAGPGAFHHLVVSQRLAVAHRNEQ